MTELNSNHRLLKMAYRAFDDRDLETVLQTMTTDVVWPNGMEGGVVLGHEGVREYWTRQWSTINPHVEPVSFLDLDDGRVMLTVHQLVKDLNGNTIFDGEIKHTYSFADGLICAMEIGQ